MTSHPDVSCFVLAGGLGERLYPLTLAVPKPLLGFGAVHSLLDFTLCNCIHSGIRKAYVLSQYRSDEVGTHLRGYRTDYPEVEIINQPPVSGKRYRGTGDAVRQNLDLVDTDLVLVLSADHVYRMDYRKLLGQATGLDFGLTAASIPVPPETAAQYGILSIDAHGRITRFEEKPRYERGPAGGQTWASMGIYVFRTEVLRDALAELSRWIADLDFGRHVLPYLTAAGVAGACRVLDQGPQEYWRDVGTLEAYHQAHMDLIGNRLGFDTHDPSWSIRASEHRFSTEPPSSLIVADSARIGDCRLESSVIGPGVVIGDGAHVDRSVLLAGSQIGCGARVHNAIVDAWECVEDRDRIGVDPLGDAKRFGRTDSGVVIVSDLGRDREAHRPIAERRGRSMTV